MYAYTVNTGFILIHIHVHHSPVTESVNMLYMDKSCRPVENKFLDTYFSRSATAILDVWTSKDPMYSLIFFEESHLEPTAKLPHAALQRSRTTACGETCFHKHWETEVPGGVQLLPTLHDRAGLVSRALPTSAPRPFLGLGDSSPVCSAGSMLITVALGMPTLAHKARQPHHRKHRLGNSEEFKSPFLPWLKLNSSGGEPGGEGTAVERAESP